MGKQLKVIFEITEFKIFLCTLLCFSAYVKTYSQQNYNLDFSAANKVTSTVQMTELNGVSKFTIEGEVYLDSQTSLTNLFSKIYDNNNRVALQISSGIIYAIVSNGSNSYSRTTNAVLETGKWYHISMVYDGTLSTASDRVKIFVNGIEETNLTTSGTLPATTSSNSNYTSKPFVVGGTYYDGKIDDVRVWNTALGATKINDWKFTHLETTHPNYANLKLYWDFDDNYTSTTAYHILNTVYNGTISGATYNADFNKVATFKPGNTISTSGSVTELNNASAFTLEAKVFLDSQTSLTNVLSKISSNTSRIALQISDGTIYAIVANGSNTYCRTSNSILTTDKWYHIAMVFDGAQTTASNRVKLYIDGVEQTNMVYTGTLPTQSPSNTQTFKVGGTYFDGKIDEVRVWNTALLQSTINRWKNMKINSTHLNSSNLKLYWDFNTATSTTVSGAFGTTYSGSISGAYTSGSAVANHVVGGYVPYYYMSNFASVNPTGVMDKLTHFYYFSISTDASGNLGRVSSSNGSYVFTPISSISSINTDINNIMSWKGTKSTKIILVLGGEISSLYIHDVAASSTARNNLAQQLVSYCYQKGFDGIDIDWENYNGLIVNDANYVALVSAIKSQINSQAPSNNNKILSLSITIRAEHDSPNDPIGLAGLFGNIDYLQVMSYGKSRIAEGTQVPMSKIQEYYRRWTNAGLPSTKLVIGLPAYAKTTVDDTTLYYKDILAANPSLNIALDTVVSNGNTYYYNGVNTIKSKSQYVLDNNLKGVMFWELTQDANVSNSKSLLKGVNDVISVVSGASASKSVKTLGNQEEIISNNFIVYPNPTRDIFKISFQSTNPEVTDILVYDINGRVVWKNTKKIYLGANVLEINAKGFNKGVYILKITEKDKIVTQKLIKN